MKKEFKDKNLLVISSGFPDKTNTFYGGIFVKEQLKYLKNYFNKVFVISPVPRSFRFTTQDKLCQNYEFGNVKVYFPRFWHAPISFFRKRLGENQFKVVDRLIKRENIKFDLIHAHFTWPSGYVGAKLKEKYRKPVVITVHENRDWFLEEYNSKNPKLIYTWKSADSLIRVNKVDVPLLKKHNINTYSIPNGFSENKFYPLDKNKCREKLNVPFDKKILLTIANLVEQKGHKYAIEAIEKIIKRRKDVVYYIGGSGPLKDKLYKEVVNKGLQDYIKFVGFIPDEELNFWMNACDIFVLPSLSEGNPTVMFEALGCGKPFIGTKVGGIPEIIISEELGILVEPGNSKQLADAILKALNKEWNKEYILNYARQHTWEKIARRIMELYKNILIENEGTI